jgi:hypothetical protein
MAGATSECRRNFLPLPIFQGHFNRRDGRVLLTEWGYSLF